MSARAPGDRRLAARGALLDRPLALDNAISAGAAAIKKIYPVAGRANVLVVPDLEAGNMLAKSLSFLADADAAGIVLGARVPVILTSRADSLLTRLASCAVAVLVAAARRKAAAHSVHREALSGMDDGELHPVLAGKKALVFGIANEDCIAYGCAKAFRLLGADLAVSWLNEKARRFVEPLAQELEASITGAVDVEVPRQAASGLKHFELMLNEAAHKAPLGELIDIVDVGFTCAYLATPFAKRMTGELIYVDGGANLIA